MKKTILRALITLHSIVLPAQSKIEKDIMGTWQLSFVKIDGLCETNYENRKLTGDKVILDAVKKDETGNLENERNMLS